MARENTNLPYITNNIEEKVAYENGKRSIIKEVSEISSLFGVQACAIIYSKDDPVPEVWPSQEMARDVLTCFGRLPESEKEVVSQESFVCQEIKKCHEQFTRLQSENNQKAMKLFMYRCLSGLADVKDFDMKYASNMDPLIHQYKRYISLKIDELKRKSQHIHVDAPSSSSHTSRSSIPSSGHMVVSDAQFLALPLTSLANVLPHDHIGDNNSKYGV